MPAWKRRIMTMIFRNKPILVSRYTRLEMDFHARSRWDQSSSDLRQFKLEVWEPGGNRLVGKVRENSTSITLTYVEKILIQMFDELSTQLLGAASVRELSERKE